MNSLVLQLALGDSSAPLPEFVSLARRYRCEKCHEALQGPSQTQCGHRICRLCLRHFLSLDVPSLCPANEQDCCEITENTVYPDISTKREMQGLAVYCTFKKYGCTITVSWKALEEHLESCLFVQVRCDTGECDVVVARKDLAEHKAKVCMYEPVPCELCENTIRRGFLEEHFREACEEAKVDCPYRCGQEGIPRKDLDQHRSVCTRKPSDCSYKAFGCTFQGSDRDVEVHCGRKAGDHLVKVYAHVVDLEGISQQVKRELEAKISEYQRLETQSKTLGEKVSHVKSVLLFQDGKLTNLTEILGQKLKEEDNLKRETQKVQVKLASVTRTCVANHQEIAGQQARFERRLEQAERQVAVSDATSRHGDIQRQVVACETVVLQQDERLRELDLRFQYLETASYDGVLIWKIVRLKDRLREAKRGEVVSFVSQPFYSSCYGYKLCARVYLDGDGMGKGSHCSIYIVIMQGMYDELLRWPFSYTVNISLLDQRGSGRSICDNFRPDPTSSSFHRPTNERTMNIASGFPLFAPQSTLQQEPYLVDDTLFFKVVIDSSR